MLIIEIDSNFAKPGKWHSVLDGKKFFRFWVGYIAVTWTEFDLKSFHDYASSGKSIWRTK